MRIGYIGLGKMGKNMVSRLLSQGLEVVVWNRSPEPLAEVAKEGAIDASSVTNLTEQLSSPRIIWLMLTAGEAVDAVLSELLPNLMSGDVVIDGGNSFYKDTIRRANLLAKKGIRFMDVGVSGGPEGAKNGACLMVGGDKKDFEALHELFATIAAPDAMAFVGPVGAGHFVKMVHNGIEYGMMEAIAEGAAVLKKSGFSLNLSEVFRVYNNRSVIESRLVGWAGEALTEDPELSNVSSVIAHTGEGEWTVEAAHEFGVDVPVIDTALTVRKQSSAKPENFRNKMVSALRGKFGQHEVKKP